MCVGAPVLGSGDRRIPVMYGSSGTVISVKEENLSASIAPMEGLHEEEGSA